MLKNILTGSKLKEEITRLENDVERLNNENKRLASIIKKDAKDEQRLKDALTEKQNAQRDLKLANTQIESLVVQVSKLKQDHDDVIKARHTHAHTKKGFYEILGQLSTITSKDNALTTICVLPEDLTGELDHPDKLKGTVPDEILTLFDSIESATGKVLFHSHVISLALIPPLPMKSSDWMMGNHFFTGMAEDIMQERTVGILMGRSGSSIVGIATTHNGIIDVTTIRSSVKGKHTKGGWSQKRFEHLRDEDVTHHINKVREHMLPLFEEYAPDIIIASGDVNLIDRMLQDIDTTIIKKSIDTKEGTKQDVAVDNALWLCRTYHL
ncbi:MAG: hypothetical protein KAH86_00840 [Methanosarcinales archaeon]|nr:hypothetical protein [Methanosarcinales archaeon]